MICVFDESLWQSVFIFLTSYLKNLALSDDSDGTNTKTYKCRCGSGDGTCMNETEDIHTFQDNDERIS